MNVTILDQNGLAILCASDGCLMAASGWRLNTLGKPVYYCAEHDPSGPPCPLCNGSGRLAP